MMSAEGELAQSISVKEFIDAVSNELIASRAERIAAGRPPVFEVAALDIELSVTVTRSSKKAGGVDLKVLRADAEGATAHESVQKVLLHLTSTTLSEDEQESEVFDASSPVRPRRDFGRGL